MQAKPGGRLCHAAKQLLNRGSTDDFRFNTRRLRRHDGRSDFIPQQILPGAVRDCRCRQLLTDLTVADICDGFIYDELEGKGLFGWGGRLVIQPEYQRNRSRPERLPPRHPRAFPGLQAPNGAMNARSKDDISMAQPMQTTHLLSKTHCFGLLFVPPLTRFPRLG